MKFDGAYLVANVEGKKGFWHVLWLHIYLLSNFLAVSLLGKRKGKIVH